MATAFSKLALFFCRHYFFALGCNALDIDRLSEFIKTFNLVEIAHSVEMFQNTQAIHGSNFVDW